MDSSIKEKIQSFFSTGTLTIVGSGLSCAEGIPGMGELANKLLDNIPALLEKPNPIWDNIKTELEKSSGLEETLLQYPPDEELSELIIKVTNDYLLSKEKEVLERVIIGNEKLKFEDYIVRLPITDSGLPLITTNYDRLLEFACERVNLYIDSSFLGRFFGNYDPEGSRYSFCKNIKRQKNAYMVNYQKRIKVYKPHGCFSWHLINGKLVSTNIDLNNPSLIITPGFNKYKAGYDRPFDMHREGANREIDKSIRYIIIGYGFNDDHLETHLMAQIKSGKPTLIITYKLSEKALELVNSQDNVIAVESGDDAEQTFLYFERNKHEINNKRLWDLCFFVKEIFNEG